MLESGAPDWIELTRHEREARRSIQGAETTLLVCGIGETDGQIDTTSTAGHNVTSQMRKPARLDLQHVTDVLALLDRLLGEANFFFEPGAAEPQ